MLKDRKAQVTICFLETLTTRRLHSRFSWYGWVNQASQKMALKNNQLFLKHNSQKSYYIQKNFVKKLNIEKIFGQVFIKIVAVHVKVPGFRCW